MNTNNDLTSESQVDDMPDCVTKKTAGHCCVILDSISEGVFVVDREFRITTLFNRAAERITGFSAQQALGRHCFSVLRADICEHRCAVAKTFKTGRPVEDYRATIINKDGRKTIISITTGLIKDDKGEAVGVVELFRDMTAIETLRNALQNKYRLGHMIGKHPKIRQIFDILPDIAESDSTVLIQGSSGSGKSLLANVIHEKSPRRDHPFIKVNCGAIPDTLLESELFGYVKGAFTDARRDKPGRFSQADGGTLFLDEIGDMSPAMQVKLLRVLEDKSYIPLGDTKTVTTDCRVIAASNKDITQLVMDGKFREDLYYRLNVMRIELPPLRERREDIPLLIDHLLAKLNSERGKNIAGVSEEVMELLMNYHFPGNIRELENILEHAYVLCKESFIQKRHLPVAFVEEMYSGLTRNVRKSLLESSEARTIRRALERNNGNRIKAARELGISRSTLWRKIKKFQLDRQPNRPPKGAMS